MRPKKRILLISSDEYSLSVRRFLLETRGYRVIGTCDAMEGLALFGDESFDVVVIDLKIAPIDGNAMIVRMRKVKCQVPTILIGEDVKPGELAHEADAFLGAACCSPADLIERVKAMTRCKRGPKKPPASVLPIAVEVAHG